MGRYFDTDSARKSIQTRKCAKVIAEIKKGGDWIIFGDTVVIVSPDNPMQIVENGEMKEIKL